jgi:hypothetical protein
VVDDFLPFTKEDNKCYQKWLTKQKNRAQLSRILKIFAEDGYCNYRFEKK